VAKYGNSHTRHVSDRKESTDSDLIPGNQHAAPKLKWLISVTDEMPEKFYGHKKASKMHYSDSKDTYH